MGVCYIVAAGDMFDEFPIIKPDDLLIAADAGYLHLQKLNMEPHILLGDFDSMSAPENKDIIVHPVMKDDTDTMLAVKLGFEKGYTEFVIYGALGGERTDHTVANIQSLAFIAEKGGKGTLVGNGELFTLIKNTAIEIFKGDNPTFSVFAYGREAEGVTIIGSLFDVENASLSPFFPLGVSNKIKEEKVRISVEEGYLLIVYNR